MRPRQRGLEDLARKLLVGVLFVALSCVPSLVQAEQARADQVTTGAIADHAPTQPAQLDYPPGSAQDYAAREAAAPQLTSFAGGGSGIYIGTGALVVALLVVVVVLLVR